MEKIKAFQKITNAEELKEYLDDSARLKSSRYLYHYTSLKRVVEIVNGRKWYLTNPIDMNDQLEYYNGDRDRWKKLFFNCFMMESKESIGMWSMYSQPWEKGVKIAIPKEIFMEWVNELKCVYEVKNNIVSEQTILIGEQNLRIWISCVAYSNTDSGENKKDDEKITWNTVSNSNIKKSSYLPELTGYIKDMAWAYEKEVRIKAEFDNIYEFEKVAINIPDKVIDSMIITASPLFEGNLLEQLEKEIQRSIKTEDSIFKGKLKITTPCEKCTFKLNTLSD